MIMVDIEKGICMIQGTGMDMVMDCTVMLHTVFETLEKHHGKDTAMEILVNIGRDAVKTDEELGIAKISR